MGKRLKLGELEESLKSKDVEFALEFLTDLKKEHGSVLDRLINKYKKKKDSRDREKARFSAMTAYEEQAYNEGLSLVAGVDEAGRGPLAGPVVAAAVMLPRGVFIEHLNDSKKLSPQRRAALYEEIREKAAAIGVGIIDEKKIDEINIYNATLLAMEQAVASLKPRPDILLIDALKLKNINITQLSIIKGDAKSISIAAASIIAKVTRDRLLVELDKRFPLYGFCEHKGYGTEEHISAIKKYGICPIHRISFTKNFTAGG